MPGSGLIGNLAQEITDTPHLFSSVSSEGDTSTYLHAAYHQTFCAIVGRSSLCVALTKVTSPQRHVSNFQDKG